MLLKSLNIRVEEFERGTGWQIKPEGACKGDVCVPLPAMSDDSLDVKAVAQALQMPIAEESSAQLWALGPESLGGRALTTAAAPELELPDIFGNSFRLSSLLGQKVLVYAWAPY
jgi:hypothetical protein